MLRAEAPPGYEVLCLAPGFQLDEISVKCWDSGKLLIRATPKDPAMAAMWGVTPMEKVVQLPRAVQASSAQALLTLHGQLYLRVNDAP